MTNNQIYYYGGVYPVQTSLVAPVQALTSTDLRDESGDGPVVQDRIPSPSDTYNRLHNDRFRYINAFAEDSELATNIEYSSPHHSNFKRPKPCHSPSNTCEPLSKTLIPSNNLSKSDDCDMDFEIYQTALIKNAFAPCPLQIPLEENCFCPRATSTPTSSPENSSKFTHHSTRSPVPRKPVKRKLQFSSEDEEAVFYLQSKYLNQGN